MEKREVLRSLFNLQQQFKAGKDGFNKFGNFKYRNLESMMANLKPYLDTEQCIILIDHEPVEIANLPYIKTKATLVSLKDFSEVSATATVQDGDKRTRNELCNAQITGGALSYSGKYAVGFLLGLSNEEDPDAYDPNKDAGRPQSVATPARQQTKQEKVAAMIAEAAACDSIDALTAFWKRIGNWQKEVAIKAAVANRRHELEGGKQ